METNTIKYAITQWNLNIPKTDSGVKVANFDFNILLNARNTLKHNIDRAYDYETSLWAKGEAMHFLDNKDEMITPLNNLDAWLLIALEFLVQTVKHYKNKKMLSVQSF